MGKVFWILASVCGAIFFGGNLYAGYAYSRDSTAAFNDYKQMVKPNGETNRDGLKSSKPESEFGRQTMPYYRRIQERSQEFLKLGNTVTIGDVLNWPNINNPEGRAASLKHIAYCQEAWRSYITDVWKIRREMLSNIDATYARALKFNCDDLTAQEGKYLRIRTEIFDESSDLVKLVGQSKLIRYNGKIVFDGADAHYETYKKTLDDIEKRALAFDKEWQAYKDRNKDERADQFDRLRDQAYGTHP